uniref:MATH domain-containing protein n=1 Tax=Romanomermis culicivorax TaxID=13658 RepID=A0A915JYF6_ROMCU
MIENCRNVKNVEADPETWWSCRARGSMMTLSPRAHFSCMQKEIDFKFTSSSTYLGYKQFIDFKELIDPEKGLINNDNVIFQVWITVSEIQMQKLSILEKNAVFALKVVDCLEKYNNLVVMPSKTRDLLMESFKFTVPEFSSPGLFDRSWSGATDTKVKFKLRNPTEFISITPQYLINLWEFLQRDNYIPKPDAKSEASFKKLLNSVTIVDISGREESSGDKSINDSSRQNIELATPQESASANSAEFRDKDKSGIDSRKRRMENSEIPNKIFRISETMNSDENSSLAVLSNISSKSQENGRDFKRFLQQCVRNVAQNFNLYFIPRFLRTVQISTDQFLIICSDRFSFNWLHDQISKKKFDNVELSLLTSKMEAKFELMINFSISTSDDETLDHVINLLENQNPRLKIDQWKFFSMTRARDQQNEWKIVELMFKICNKSLYELILANFRIFYDLDQILVKRRQQYDPRCLLKVYTNKENSIQQYIQKNIQRSWGFTLAVDPVFKNLCKITVESLDCGNSGLQQSEKDVVFQQFPLVLHLKLMQFICHLQHDQNVMINNKFVAVGKVILKAQIISRRGDTNLIIRGFSGHNFTTEDDLENSGIEGGNFEDFCSSRKNSNLEQE